MSGDSDRRSTGPAVPATPGQAEEGAPQAQAAGVPPGPVPAVPVPGAGPVTQGHQARTRASATWTGIAFGAAFLVVVIVFILENLQDVKVTFFSASWRIPLGLDLLLAAVLGAAVVFSVGAVRLLQLRVRARRSSRRGGGHR
ncbi:MAG: lipopolysaccharide assembly protein LapA domain-containing protein [Acidimicrobiales bacterium]